MGPTEALRAAVRDVADFPRPGILFKDITPILGSGTLLHMAMDCLVASDVPADFRVALYPNTNPEDTIYRSKAVGEPPIMLANSVFCAIADAVHAVDPSKPVPLDAPATPEAILRACEALRGRTMEERSQA